MLKFKNTHIIEVTSVCDLKCPFCIVNNGMNRPHKMMEYSTVTNLLNQIALLEGEQIVYLFNYGEPMLYPKIGEIVQLCSDLGIISKISTNGFRLDSKGPEVVNAGLSILMIDFDGVTQKAHSTYRVGSKIEALKSKIGSLMNQISREP